MNISLYVNKSENERIKKNLTGAKTFAGSLREETSVIDPVIMIETTDNITKYNYCYIPEFGRYYFIRNISVVRNKLYKINCHVDVLMSFSSEILANSGVIERQQNKWDLYLADPDFQVESKTQIITKKFPGSFTGQHYILAIAGNNPLAGG